MLHSGMKEIMLRILLMSVLVGRISSFVISNICNQWADDISLRVISSVDRNSKLIQAQGYEVSPLIERLIENASSIRPNIVDSFSCDKKVYGYYADQDNECQIFHICVPMQQLFPDMYCAEDIFHFSFICPEHTIFNQEAMVCDWESNAFPCSEAHHMYSRNNLLFVVPEEDVQRESSSETITTTPSSRPSLCCTNRKKRIPSFPEQSRNNVNKLGQTEPGTNKRTEYIESRHAVKTETHEVTTSDIDESVFAETVPTTEILNPVSGTKVNEFEEAKPIDSNLKAPSNNVNDFDDVPTTEKVNSVSNTKVNKYVDNLADTTGTHDKDNIPSTDNINPVVNTKMNEFGEVMGNNENVATASDNMNDFEVASNNMNDFEEDVPATEKVDLAGNTSISEFEGTMPLSENLNITGNSMNDFERDVPTTEKTDQYVNTKAIRSKEGMSSDENEKTLRNDINDFEEDVSTTEKGNEFVKTWLPVERETYELTTTIQTMETDTAEPLHSLEEDTTKSNFFQVSSNGKFRIYASVLEAETQSQTTWPSVTENSQGHDSESVTVSAEHVTLLGPKIPSITESPIYLPNNGIIRSSELSDTTESDSQIVTDFDLSDSYTEINQRVNDISEISKTTSQIFNDYKGSDLQDSATESYQTRYDITEPPTTSTIFYIEKSQADYPRDIQPISMPKQISNNAKAVAHPSVHDKPIFSPWQTMHSPLREARIPLQPAIIYSVVDGNFYQITG